MPKIYAIWRVFYGEDTIYNSIMSLLPYVDKVIVYYYNKPWCGIDKVTYEDIEYPIYSPIDKSLEICKSIPNVEIIEDNHPYPAGQTSHLVNKTIDLFGRPNYLAFMNADFVLLDGQQFVDRICQEAGPVTSTRPIQTWKYPNYIFPIRQDRMSVLTYNLTHESLKDTFPSIGEKSYLEQSGRFLDDVFCFDLGFAISPTAMWYKYLLRLGVSKEISDDSPVSGWYHKIWLPWQPNLPQPPTQYGWCNGERNLGEPYKILTNELPVVLRSIYE